MPDSDRRGPALYHPRMHTLGRLGQMPTDIKLNVDQERAVVRVVNVILKERQAALAEGPRTIDELLVAMCGTVVRTWRRKLLGDITHASMTMVFGEWGVNRIAEHLNVYQHSVTPATLLLRAGVIGVATSQADPLEAMAEGWR